MDGSINDDHEVNLSAYECLDRTYLVMEMFRYISEHPEVTKNEEWSRLAEKAHSALFDLYQTIGNARQTSELAMECSDDASIPIDIGTSAFDAAAAIYKLTSEDDFFDARDIIKQAIWAERKRCAEYIRLKYERDFDRSWRQHLSEKILEGE